MLCLLAPSQLEVGLPSSPKPASAAKTPLQFVCWRLPRLPSSASQCFLPLHFLLRFCTSWPACLRPVTLGLMLSWHDSPAVAIGCVLHGWLAHRSSLDFFLGLHGFCVVETRSRRGMRSSSNLSCPMTVASRRQLQGVCCSGELANASMQTTRPTCLTTFRECQRQIISSSACCAK